MKDLFSFNFKALNDKDAGKWIAHVRRDWAIIVCVASLFLIIFAISHFSFYMTITDSRFFSREDAEGSAPERIQQKNLDSVISLYELKKKRFDAMVKDPVPFRDPSSQRVSDVPVSQTENIDLAE
ncbi:MAG: hypothetical protein WCT49_03270 [Candidatus Paceibacterota bacterium]|jgi:hypothetical protein|nr:hypothetical protein [Candidatus Paceibacterota bacterium]